MSIHGYVPYNPTDYSASVLAAVKKVCIDYDAQEHPLTVRQIFYRLVAEYQYDKTEKAYGSLINMVSRSRRAYMAARVQGEQAMSNPILIPFNWIRDDRGVARTHGGWESGDEYVEGLRSDIESLRLDREAVQPRHLELWCEAGGMVDMLSRIADPYGLRVNSGGGYDSVTAKHNLAMRVAVESRDNGRNTKVLHIGDFDPSGEGMYETLRDDVGAMCWSLGVGRRFSMERVALTQEQVLDMDIILAPPKPQDSRSRKWIEQHWDMVDQLGTEDISAQLEALTPGEIETLFTSKIEEEIDMEVHEARLEEEQEVSADLLERIVID